MGRKIYYFDIKEFKPLRILVYTQLSIENGKIRMVDFYNHGFGRDIGNYIFFEEQNVKIKRIFDILQEERLYWVLRYPHSRKAHVFITGNIISNKRQ